MGKKNKYKKEPQEAAVPLQPQQPQQQQARQGQPAEGVRDGERGWQVAGQQQQRQGEAQGGQGSQQGGWTQAGQQQRRPGAQQGGQAGQGGQQGAGYQQRGQQGGSYQQRGPQGGQQGGQQGGGYQQRGPQGGQQGAGYQQRGPPPSAGSTAVQVPQDGPIKRGTLGRPGTCAVNYLDVDLSKMPDKAFHYDVTIVPDRPKKFYRQAFDVFRTQYLKNAIAAFDGSKSCYAVDKLTSPIDGEVEVIDRYGRTVHYTITIKETDNSIVDLSSLRSYIKDKIYDKPMRAMQCLEVVLAEPCNKNAIRAGRSFFMKSGNGAPVELRDGYEALVGLYQSFVLGDKPFVNVDVSHKSFPMSMPVIDYMVNHNRIRMDDIRSGNCNNNLRDVFSFLKDINIVYEPPKIFASTPRAYKVNGFSQQPPKMLKFESDGKVITVEEYFASRGYKLQYPNLYCLHVGPPAKTFICLWSCAALRRGKH
ncbi:protein argonaute-2 isoform X3 [Drosophila nasuta]|uniref:protein argonaute-2 isoform X3 n=1 Tax=Drosophila nasuta TaxID=42062 RepID=UPI00295E226F|nr:protein argonaute-2 isoform X3 [Drosophila nasuta]